MKHAKPPFGLRMTLKAKTSSRCLDRKVSLDWRALGEGFKSDVVKRVSNGVANPKTGRPGRSAAEQDSEASRVDGPAREQLSPRHLAKQMRHVTGLLIRRKERDDDLPRAAALASQAIFDLHQWKGVA